MPIIAAVRLHVGQLPGENLISSIPTSPFLVEIEVYASNSI